MSKRSNYRQIQGGTHSVHNAYQVLQDLIFSTKGIHCSVVVTPQHVSIRAVNYREYLQAKSAIKGRVSVDIIQG